MSQYVFAEIPFTGRNVWCLNNDVRFAYWETGLLNQQRFSLDTLNQIDGLLIKYELNNMQNQDTISSAKRTSLLDSRFAYYKAPFVLLEEYFSEWLADTKTSPFQVVREEHVEGVYPLRIDKKDTFIKISLFTDLWFPWCVGLNLKKPAQTKENMYDNRQLAWRHTPRLNQCLTEIRQIVLDAGGTWEIGKENVHEEYQHMVTETGIELGMPDDVRYLKNNE